MPRTADHTARRAQIADALVRVAARDGLHAATMRSVAAEAGISLRLVQYYFHTKTGLLLGALEHLEQQSRRRWAHRVGDLPDSAPPRAFVEAFLTEALPTDEPSRVFHFVGTSYAMLAHTDPDLDGSSFAAGIDRLRGQLAAALTTAADRGELASGLDPQREAARLVALANGIGTGVLVGQHTVDSALDILRYHLDQLFTST